MASDDPPGSLMRQTAAADQPLSIGRQLVRKTRTVVIFAQIGGDSGTAKIDCVGKVV